MKMISNLFVILLLASIGGIAIGYRTNQINDRLVYREVSTHIIEVRTFPNGTTMGFYPDGTPVRPIEPRITYPTNSPHCKPIIN